MRAALLCGLWTLGCTGASATAPAPITQDLRGEAFGTTWNVRWRGDVPSRSNAEDVITGVLETIDAAMSNWRDDSELAAIRRAPGPVTVSEETALVVSEALRLARSTGGAFDPTVEPLMELWGFRGPKREAPPTDAELDDAKSRVGWNRVQVGRANGAPTVDSGGTALDLSAIAKGHAVDRVGRALSAAGAAEWMVEIGGEVRVAGRWRIGVDHPESAAAGRTFAAIAALRNVAMATSGNYRNAYDAGGQRVVHTMDPRTGTPRDSEVAAVTVVAPDCRTADGWATALMVLEQVEGEHLIEAHPQLDALWLIATDSGLEERRSTGMTDWLVDP